MTVRRVVDAQGGREVLDEEPPGLVALGWSKAKSDMEDLSGSVQCCGHKHDPLRGRGPMGAVKRDDPGAVGPCLGTRSGVQDSHFEPALFNDDIGHRSRVLFHQRLEHAGELVDGGFFGVFVLPRLFQRPSVRQGLSHQHHAVF